jgi:hypothetical protein
MLGHVPTVAELIQACDETIPFEVWGHCHVRRVELLFGQVPSDDLTCKLLILLVRADGGPPPLASKKCRRDDAEPTGRAGARRCRDRADGDDEAARGRRYRFVCLVERLTQSGTGKCRIGAKAMSH